MHTKYYPRIGEQTVGHTLVLANGDFPRSPLALELIARWQDGQQGYYLICCDGAVQKLWDALGCLPDAVVGDLDSIDPALKERLGERLHQVSEQDTNDLTKSIRYLASQGLIGAEGICILGASGGREDHLLGNIFLLPGYLRYSPEVVMLTDMGHFRVVQGSVEVETYVGQQLSVFTPAMNAISLTGVHWPLVDQALPAIWCGTLNRADEERIRLVSQEPCLLYLVD